MEFQLWSGLLGMLGICATGFFVLLKRVNEVNDEVKSKVSKDWLENTFQSVLNKKMDKMNETLESIKDAIVGNFKDKGLITKVEETSKSLSDIQKKCLKNHGE
jgi:uncharacterized protein with von Willebrand factor type A (vWA) domain